MLSKEQFAEEKKALSELLGQKKIKESMLYIANKKIGDKQCGNVVFVINKMQAAIYPNVDAVLISEQEKNTIGVLHFAIAEKFGDDFSDGAFEPGKVYDIKTLPNFIKEFKIKEIDKEFYDNQLSQMKQERDDLEKQITELEKFIKENC